MNRVKELQNEILYRSNVKLLTFALTDFFYLPIMLLVYVMPFEGVLFLVSLASVIIAGVIMNKVTCMGDGEQRTSLADILRYFPVHKKDIRKSQYGLLFQITGIQLLLTLIPLAVTAFQFDLRNAVVTVFLTAFEMLLVGVSTIELNLRCFGRK